MKYKDLSWFSRYFLRLPYLFYNEKISVLYGKRFIQITTVGRTTNKERKTLLEVIGIYKNSPVVIAAFGEKSDWVKNLRKSSKTVVVWSNKKYESNVLWLNNKDSKSILKQYEKNHSKLLKFYERILKLAWYDFSNLPICYFPEES